MDAAKGLHVNATKLDDGNATGSGELLGIPLAWVETNRGQSLLLAFACVVIASLLSILNIYQHLQHYSRPQLQRYIVRILVVVPVYALGSFLSLKFVHQALYFDTIRDIYEAFVVYSFLALVLSFAGGESVCVLKMQGEPDITHAWPLNKCLTPIGRDGRLLRNCKRATIQFVLIKPVFAVLSLIMLVCGQYESFAYQLFLTVVYNISYSLALYGLWLFYFATKHILQPFSPVLKFFAVKIVIFLTFWQSGLIDLIPHISDEQSFAWKDLVLCVEMVPFALVHLLAFNASQFKKQNLDRMPDSEVLKNMKEVLSLSDILADAYHNFMPSYQEYMLQRADASGRGRFKRTASASNVHSTDNSSGAEDTPTPMMFANARAPTFVIDDEETSQVEEEKEDREDVEEEAELEEVDLEAGERHSSSSSSSDEVFYSPTNAQTEMEEESREEDKPPKWSTTSFVASLVRRAVDGRGLFSRDQRQEEAKEESQEQDVPAGGASDKSETEEKGEQVGKSPAESSELLDSTTPSSS